VISPYTGKRWLDRNLGATQVCTSPTDVACYGDYYQWGRNTDGHEKATSDTNTTLATDINNAGVDFIIGGGDWTTSDSTGSLRAVNWNKTDGTSVCPTGYRVPTTTELRNETMDADLTKTENALVDFLKVPRAGERLNNNGSFSFQGDTGMLWTTNFLNGSVSNLWFSESVISKTEDGPAMGYSVRCIMDGI
jgi:uncharacterized protein (TIGR02145 family)